MNVRQSEIDEFQLGLNTLPIDLQAIVAAKLRLKDIPALCSVSHVWEKTIREHIFTNPSIGNRLTSRIICFYLTSGFISPGIQSSIQRAKITHLDLSEVQLNLRTLSTKITKLDTLFFPDTSCIPSLRKLSCCWTPKADANPNILKNLTNLEELRITIQKERLNGEVFSSLPSSIRKLHCVSSGLIPGNRTALQPLTNLQILDFSGNRNAKSYLPLLPPSIRTLKCICCGLEDNDIANLQPLTNIQKLNIESNEDVTKSCIPSLESLRLTKLKCDGRLALHLIEHESNIFFNSTQLTTAFKNLSISN